MSESLEIRTFLNQIYPVPDRILDTYLGGWEKHHRSGKEVMTRPGQTEHYMYYVLEGVQKSYYLHGGKQHIIAFTYPPSFSGIPESFLTQTPSKYFLECISDSKFLRIPYRTHEKMLDQYRAIETLFRKATEHLITGLVDRQYEWMALDIETRFRHFVQRSPHLLNLVSHKDLASYLHMDPTNFSKMYNRIRI